MQRPLLPQVRPRQVRTEKGRLQWQQEQQPRDEEVTRDQEQRREPKTERIKDGVPLRLFPGIVSDRFISRIWWLSSCVAAAAAPTAALPTSLPIAEEFRIIFFQKKFKKTIVLCLGEEDPSVVGEMAIGHDRWSDLCQWGL